MRPPTHHNDTPYREQFFAAARGLLAMLKYLVFLYIVGSAIAVIALSMTTGLGSANFSLACVLGAYGVAALSAAVLLYAFVKLIILACCAYGEWLCEHKHEGEPQ